VQKQANKYVTCSTEISEVELTFFSTFPKFGLKVNQTKLINPFEGAPCDTLLNLENVIGIVDLSSLIKNKVLIINDFRLNNWKINAFTDISGISNYDVFSLETDTVKDESAGLPFSIIDVQNVELKDVDIAYINKQTDMSAVLRNFSAKINGLMNDDDIQGFIDTKPFDIIFDYRLDETSKISADIRRISLNISGEAASSDIKANLKISPTDIDFHLNSDSLHLIAGIKDFSFSFDGEMKDNLISGKIILNPTDFSLNYNGDKYLKNTFIGLNQMQTLI
jgi:hypothetical protein